MTLSPPDSIIELILKAGIGDMYFGHINRNCSRGSFLLILDTTGRDIFRTFGDQFDFLGTKLYNEVHP